MVAAVTLSSREAALVARREGPQRLELASAGAQTREATTAPIDAFERAPRADHGTASTPDDAMAGIRSALNGAGAALQQHIESSAPVKLVGQTLDAHCAPVFDAIARALDTRVDSDTLRRSSFLVGTGLRLNVPGVNLNGGVWSTLYVPSIELAHQAKTPSQALYLNYGADLESPIGGLGWGRRGKASTVVNLFFVTASFDEKQSIVFVGIPGIFGVTLGSDVERGSYATFQNAFPLTPLWFFGPLWTVGLEIYSPLLDPLTKHVVRPVASAIVKGVNAVSAAVGAGWRALRGWLAADDVRAPA